METWEQSIFLLEHECHLTESDLKKMEYWKIKNRLSLLEKLNKEQAESMKEKKESVNSRK